MTLVWVFSACLGFLCPTSEGYKTREACETARVRFVEEARANPRIKVSEECSLVIGASK
jgi:hypothetical protein